MSFGATSAFAEDLLRAPAGVALLARLEIEQRADQPWFKSPTASDHEAVRRAATNIGEVSFAKLLSMATWSAEFWAGPWSGQALSSLPYLYKDALSRRPIAEAVADRFSLQLHRAIDLNAQQWWHEDTKDMKSAIDPCFTDYSHVYGNGEFTWSGLWTVTDPPPEVHDDLISAWDYFGRPTSRWLLPLRRDARVWNIDNPRDWARLVETYPKVVARPHSGWELPGPNQHPSDTKMLRSMTSQRAVRTETTAHVLPDWEKVATDFDGVHLSWAGFLTTEGHISDLSNGGITMMRYWGSERTLWLHDVFGEPEPLTAPTITGRFGGGGGVDASADTVRRGQDSSIIHTLLGRW
jgi:hypothetical protein